MDLFQLCKGKGTTLVFNHGWLMSHRIFQRQEPLCENFRLVLWDLPGHGQSEKRPEGYTLTDCAAALKQVVEAQEIESAVAVGWSMGSNVFWEYFRNYGTAPFQSLLNVDTVPWSDEKKFLVKETEHAVRKDRVKAAKKFIKRMFYQEPDEATMESLVAESLEIPLDTALQLYREIAISDYLGLARTLRIPMAYWMGRYGFYADQVDDIARTLPNIPVQWFETSGHMPFWEQAEIFNRKIIESF